MIYIALIIGIQIIVLYSCVAISTDYDQMIDDREQENFLKDYNK